MGSPDPVLFRFSVLRGAEPSGDLRPIGLQQTAAGPDDSLAGVAERAAAMVAAPNAADLTTGDLTEALGPVDRWSDQRLQGLRSLAAEQMREAIRVVVGQEQEAVAVRLHSAAGLLTMSVLLGELADLDPATPVQEWIRLHPIVLGDLAGLGVAPPWRPIQGLARSPGIADHFVVRQELLGYQMGEIEDIKNYLRGESKRHSLRYLKVTEEESVTETESETTRTDETATQQRAKMSSAAQETANATVGLDARVQTDGQYGPTKVSTDVGFQYSSTSSQARQTASEMATDVLQRSVEVVRERELRRITRRARVELEENRRHAVDNTDGGGHLVGIYRWVDSVWKATTYQVGRRLVLEFLVPQPGRAVMPSAAPALPPGLPPEPPAPPGDLFATLTAAKAAELAIRYGAEGIGAPPLERQVIGVPFGTTEFKDGEGDRVKAVVVKDVKVPDGYVGETVFVVVTGMDRGDTDVASNIVVDVPGARPATFLDQPGGPTNPFLVPAPGQPAPVGRPNPDIRTLTLQATGLFGPGATVPVTVYSEDLRGFTGFVEVHCRVSAEAMDHWRLDTVQALTAAYRSRLAEWESAKLARSFEVVERPPDPDLDALCRHVCLASLMGGWPATGGRHEPDGWPRPGALAGASGALIQFLEQAIEWHNLQYVAYPYYWADRADWKTLMAFDHADPHVREFLRSGAVRIVVPVPLDRSEAMLFYLQTGVPWSGGPAPIPGDPGYLAIADEIRQARVQAGDDEEVVDEFQYTLPTALTILQETGGLPPLPAGPP